MSIEDELQIDLKGNIDHEVILSLLHTVSRLKSYASKFFAKQGLTDTQFNILLTLKSFPAGLSQRQICDKLVLLPSNIVGLLDKLSKLGWIERQPGKTDRRHNLIVLTEHGREFVEMLEVDYLGEVARLMQGISVEQKKELISVIAKIRSNLAQPIS